MNMNSSHHLPTPALAAALGRRFDPNTKHRLISLYGWIASQGGLEENAPLRTAGSSFNPRPARYAILALNHLAPTSELETTAVLLRAVPNPLAAPAEFSQGAAVAHRLASTSPAQLDSAELPLECCVALDAVRHLHLSESPTARDVLEYARQLCELAAGQSRAETICRLLNHAITQQAALLAAKEAP
jgi:hypothetical protein